jgi:pyruvate/2-oxoglutarate/acetoin dehydrogenase E1 component
MTSVLDSLNRGLQRAMARDERVYLLGEDILDPYGGAFKVTRGLSSAYPARVISTPISEAAITGIAAGMALRGLRPVVEIMFGDFLTLAADQLINHAAKFRWMYNDQVRVPMLLRTPMGGRRGYGPTHSQSLEKLFLGVPGLRVLAPANLGDPGALLEHTILNSEDPVLFIENKLLYLLPVYEPEPQGELEIETGGELDAPTYTLRVRGSPAPTITLAAYGYMAELARQAILRLAYESEIFAELVVPTGLAPFELSPLLASLRRTHCLLTLEEGGLSAGWGAEAGARSAEALGPRLKKLRRLAAKDLPIPASGPLEQAVLPDINRILCAARSMIRE